MTPRPLIIAVLLVLLPPCSAADPSSIRFKDLARPATAMNNDLVGYGVLTGLSGTGDSSRSAATNQSIRNMLKRFGVDIDGERFRSRNSAAVMVTARLSAYAQPGSSIDVNVTSLGDARSLVGGTLMMTPLKGADGGVYALAQGALSVGGFLYDANGNLVQKNHATAGTIPGGATVQKVAPTQLMREDGTVEYVLTEPDVTTAKRIETAINASHAGGLIATATSPARIRLKVPEVERSDLMGFLASVERVRIQPDSAARVVINERTGTVVSGGRVRIDPVAITHGAIRVDIDTRNAASQPILVSETGSGVRTEVVSNTDIEVSEGRADAVTLEGRATVGDLVAALSSISVSSRDVITILQGIKRAGALHAELVIQ